MSYGYGCFQLDDSETMRTWQMRYLKWMTKKQIAMFYQTSMKKFVLGVSRPAICWSQELASALTTAGQHELTLSLLEAFQSGEKNRKTRGKERPVYLKKFYIAADSNSNWSILIRLCWMILRGNFETCGFLSSAPLLIVFILPSSDTSKSSYPRPCAYHIHNFGRRFSSCRRSDSCWCPGCCIRWCPLSLWGDLAQGSQNVWWVHTWRYSRGGTFAWYWRVDHWRKDLLLKVCQNRASLWCNLWGVEESFRDDFLSCQQAGCIGWILNFHKQSFQADDRKWQEDVG